MSDVTQLQLRRGTTAECNAMTPAVGEIICDYERKQFRAGDGSTAGGFPLVREGLLSKSVAGGSDVTLTNLEASNPVIELTGAITANISVIFPAFSGKFWLVRNKTTGDFTITLKHATGTGVRILRNQAILVYRDGTNLVIGRTEDELWSGIKADLKGAQVFDGVTSGSKVTSTLTGQNIGTGDFSMRARIRVPNSNPSAVAGIMTLSSDASTAAGNGTALDITTGGDLRFMFFGATTSDQRNLRISSFISNYGGRIVDLVATRTGSTVKLFINGIEATTTEQTAGTPPAFADSITTTYLHLGIEGSTARFTGEIYRATVFNCVLTQRDIDEIQIGEIPDRLKFGSQAAKYTSDFSAGVNSWLANQGTHAGNIDGVSDGSTSYDDVLRFYADGTNQTSHGAYRSVLTGGKRYLVSFRAFLPTANTNAKGFVFQYGTGLETAMLTAPQWTSFAYDVVAGAGNPYIVFYQRSASNGAFTGANSVSNDLLYLRDVVVTQLGAIVDLDLGAGVGYQAPDRSTNNLHGTISASGVSHKLPTRRGQLRFTTNTNGNQQALGQVAIPTNARILYIVAKVTGTPTVAVGNASAGAQIVASGALASGRNDLTLLTRYSTTGNIWVSSNTTDAIEWTVGYEIVD